MYMQCLSFSRQKSTESLLLTDPGYAGYAARSLHLLQEMQGCDPLSPWQKLNHEPLRTVWDMDGYMYVYVLIYCV